MTSVSVQECKMTKTFQQASFSLTAPTKEDMPLLCIPLGMAACREIVDSMGWVARCVSPLSDAARVPLPTMRNTVVKPYFDVR